MSKTFRKISRVGSLTGGTKWYLSDDCLLSAKRTLYAVEYGRFYLRDLESIVVWPSRSWWSRMIIPGVFFAGLGACFWGWVDSTTGAILVGIGVAWAMLELALGPTARSCVCTTGTTIEIPLVKRTRRANKVLAEIDAAVRAARGMIEPPNAPQATSSAAPRNVETSSAAAAATRVAAATQTNGS